VLYDHFPPPSLQHHYLLNFILHLNFLPRRHEDVVSLQLQFMLGNPLALILRYKLTLIMILLSADISKSVEQSLSRKVVIDKVEFFSDEHVLFLGDVHTRTTTLLMGLSELGLNL
jgi:hypothetical protein